MSAQIYVCTHLVPQKLVLGTERTKSVQSDLQEEIMTSKCVISNRKEHVNNITDFSAEKDWFCRKIKIYGKDFSHRGTAVFKLN